MKIFFLQNINPLCIRGFNNTLCQLSQKSFISSPEILKTQTSIPFRIINRRPKLQINSSRIVFIPPILLLYCIHLILTHSVQNILNLNGRTRLIDQLPPCHCGSPDFILSTIPSKHLDLFLEIKRKIPRYLSSKGIRGI